MKLTLEEKIAQMIILDLDRKEFKEETFNMIKKLKIGGVVLYKKNYENYAEMLDLINKLKGANKENDIPLFVSIDQEGGRVNRFPKEIHNIKTPFKIAETKNFDTLNKSGDAIGELLNNTGINMNFAPVMDVKRFSDSHPIGDRCYGDNKDDVIKNAITVMKAMKKKNVIPVIKHFPGHGLTEKDSHFFLIRVKESIEKIESEDMAPFETAILEGCDAIMISHLIINEVDKKNPACFSNKLIKGYLKDKLNFKGLIITDDLKMLAIRLRNTPRNAVYKAIKAGNDIAMVGGVADKKVIDIIKYIAKKVKRGKIDIKEIDKSVEKIIDIKKRYNVNDETINGINVEKINEKIDEINGLVEEMLIS